MRSEPSLDKAGPADAGGLTDYYSWQRGDGGYFHVDYAANSLEQTRKDGSDGGDGSKSSITGTMGNPQRLQGMSGTVLETTAAIDYVAEQKVAGTDLQRDGGGDPPTMDAPQAPGAIQQHADPKGLPSRIAAITFRNPERLFILSVPPTLVATSTISDKLDPQTIDGGPVNFKPVAYNQTTEGGVFAGTSTHAYNWTCGVYCEDYYLAYCYYTVPGTFAPGDGYAYYCSKGSYMPYDGSTQDAHGYTGCFHVTAGGVGWSVKLKRCLWCSFHV